MEWSLIASTGCKVKVNSITQPVYNNLAALSGDKTNYWATEAVKALQSLSSGHVKSNVFVRDSVTANGFTEFTMVLPGCVARVKKNSRGEYLVYSLEADTSFDEMQNIGKRPGLYRVARVPEGWDAKLVKNGQVAKLPNRVVAVTDSHKHARLAANLSAPMVSGTPVCVDGITLGKDGFDLHHTHGKGSIGGMLNIKRAFGAETDSSLEESAVLLARSMAASRDIESVRWISVKGGSGVLTHAMRILKDQGINFSGTDHYVFFSHLTTLSVPAENLARQIGLKFDRDTKSVSRQNLNELVGGTGMGFGSVVASWNRYRQDPAHTALKLGTDVSKEVSASVGGMKSLRASAAATGAAMGIIGATGGAGLGIPASITFATAVFGVAAGVGPGLVKAWLPHYYHKIKSKL